MTTIRRRVARTLALPVVAALLLLAVVVAIEAAGYRRAVSSAGAVTRALAVQDLVQELQNERGLAAGLLGGNASFRAELGPARARVDDRRARVAAGPELQALPGVRTGTDTGTITRADAFAFYTGRITDLNRLDTGLGSSGDDELRRGQAVLQALGDAKEALAQERAFLNGVFSAGGFRTGEFLQFVTMRAAKDTALAGFVRYATGDQRASADYVFGTGAGQIVRYFEGVALASGDGRDLQVNPQSWWSALTTVLDDLLRLEQHVGSVIRARALLLRDQAARRMGGLGALVLLCLAGAACLAVAGSRSIARPLARLATQADELAIKSLPDAVRRVAAGDHETGPPPVVPPSDATAEVRSLAGALDRVQATAYALATEQAQLRHGTTESLADLGRRHQNLLRRQLALITRLEREETDPAGLADLFELDHLATRMRRNAESLLVLVGATGPRTWSEPVPVEDVIRAAVSEVEEYRRVTLRRVDETRLTGAGATAVAHLLAELVENGLAFSAPEVDVEIQGRLVGEQYLIAVVDQGIGMTATDLAEANRRLRGEADFLTAPARYLGHYVVGRLARDLGAEVVLTPSPVTGVTARVVLPASLVAEAPALAGPAFPGAPGSALPVAAEPALPVAGPVTRDEERLRPASVEYLTAPALPQQRPAPIAETDSSRTPNGLPRRPPRTPRVTRLHPVPAPPPGDELADDPEEVRSRLDAFRGGVARGADTLEQEDSHR
ncbi:nitrate- and nitrite sensing domain-containing protein [Actinoplanes bogorensis]|uniref:histidine kinase n=1 Tax=Paractinoplanes bogorensis TaxID=1610840 RepID=A0ABS5YP13_9ACTN|nr:nitrate- and nitrite sensing domain-containing protein [Actinoplanes bogorensis]MBU2665207.1 nitrate- and nitrite sensing domain-containing protein [Actinoplanes bogorensis]